MDEDFELCQHTFPETATFRCEEKNRDRYYNDNNDNNSFAIVLCQYGLSSFQVEV